MAASLGLPPVAKDTIKDALMSVLDAPDVEARERALGLVLAALAVHRTGSELVTTGASAA